MIALGAAVAGVWSQFKSAIQYTKEFEKSLSNLRALTGASSDDLKFYRQAAKDLGDQFGTTGAEMVEAFKIVGSAKSELLKSREELVNVTEAAVLLSKAAGMDVPSAANSLTIAMNQFSAPAEEAGRYINVLAAGAKEGAAEIPDLSDSLTKFGAVAASSNVSIEQSVALIEALSEKGIKGEVAGTGIKSFLLKLESGARETRPSVVGLDKALENLKNQNLSNADVTKRFGLETANVALTLINQSNRVKELTSAVEGTNEAYKQAAINQDNISGATDRLSSKWTNFKETLLNGKGAFSNFFKGLLNDITDVISGLESLLKSSQELRLDAIDRENKRVLTSYQELIKVAHDRLTIEADIAQFTSNRAQWESRLITAKKQGDEEEIQKAEKKVQLYDSLLKIAIKQKEVNEKPAKAEVKDSVSDEKEKAKNASDVWQKYYNDRRALLEAERILAEGNYEKLKKNIIDFYELDVQKSELTVNQKYLLEVQKNKAIKDLELKRIDEIQKAEKEYANFLEQLNAEVLSSDAKLNEDLKAQRASDAADRIETKRIEAEGDLYILSDILDEEYSALIQSEEYKASSDARKALLDAQYADQKKKIGQDIADYEIALDQKVLAQKQQTFEATADLLGATAELMGKNTLIGKSLAIAQATINTYLAASKALASAPNPIIGAVMAAAAIAMGLTQVKQIMAVKVSKTGGGGGAASSGTGQTLSSTFTAASPRVATSQAAASQSGAIGVAQQGDAQAAKAGNATAQALQNNPPVLYVDTFEAKQNEKNAVSVKANV